MRAHARFMAMVRSTSSETVRNAAMDSTSLSVMRGLWTTAVETILLPPRVRARPARRARPHRGDGLALLVRDARVVDDRRRDDLVAVADEDAARLAVALH